MPEVVVADVAAQVALHRDGTGLGRIKDRGLTYWADPFEHQPGEINTNDGGRGVYWSDPNGHKLEILTVPYGGWPQRS